ncbi:MAG TPA: D-erythronate dehydrogenase, partial [Geminicoccaceae bacterium]|nr:D-erythronate dehydrogenase [Geminicoccaceae bacterium]
RKLARALLARGTLMDRRGTVQAIREITLFDVVEADGMPDDPRLDTVAADITDAAAVRRVIGRRTDGVFHLAAVVSANAEEDFDLGYTVNLDGTRHVLEACRALHEPARLVFASSVAVYGGVMPEVLDDVTILTPQTSYGAQKAAGELLLNDYSRKGFVDGRALRLPTIVVRPGRPNRAASTFASSIIREPLVGEQAICPVERAAEMYVLSPRRVIQSLIHAFELPAADFGLTRMLTLPGITVSIGAMVDALEEVAGAEAVRRIQWQPDPRIQKIVAGWPARFDARRARAMGFEPDADVAEIIRAHIEDELGGRIA